MRVSTVRLLRGTLVGELRQPKPSRQLIVICHGYQDSSANPTIIAITELVNQKGHSTFTFTFSPSKGGTDVEQQVADLAAITKYFKSFDEIVLLGSSFGAVSTSIAAALNPRISGLVTISGFFGRRQLGREHRRAFILFKTLGLIHPRYRRILQYVNRELQPERITVPTLVIHSKEDKLVFMAQSEWFFSRLNEPKQFFILESANHGITSDAGRRAIVNTIDAWLPIVTH